MDISGLFLDKASGVKNVVFEEDTTTDVPDVKSDKNSELSDIPEESGKELTVGIVKNCDLRT